MPQSLSPSTCLSSRARRKRQDAKGSDARDPGKSFPEQLEAFGDWFRAEKGQPRDIPTRPREAGDESVSDRITHNRRDDGDRGGRLLCGAGRWRIPRDDEIDVETGEFVRPTRQPLDLPVCRSILNDNVLTLHIAVFA